MQLMKVAIVRKVVGEVKLGYITQGLIKGSGQEFKF
jgi:hypothetical protein